MLGVGWAGCCVDSVYYLCDQFGYLRDCLVDRRFDAAYFYRHVRVLTY